MNGRFYILFLSFLSLVTMQAIGIGYWRCDGTHCGVGDCTLTHSLVGSFFGLALLLLLKHCQH